MIGTDELVDEFLMRDRAWRQRDQGHTRTGWRASGLGYCLRSQTYKRLGIEPLRPIDAQTLRTFSYGDMTHDWLKGIIRRLGLMRAEEGRLADPSRDVAGHFDVLIGATYSPPSLRQLRRWSPEYERHMIELRSAVAKGLERFRDEFVLGEIKSTSSRSLSYRRKEGPSHSHTVQLGGYFSMLRADPTQLLPAPTDGRLMYVGKDSVAMVEFDLEEAWIEEADRVLADLKWHWRLQSLPPCTCDGWEVGYCDFLKPEARTITGKPRSNIKGGVDCCPPELFETAERSDA